MTKLVSRFPRDDALSSVLRSLRVRSSVFCVADMRAPWAFGVKARAVASFHVVLDGRCWVEVEGAPPIQLGGGDLVLIPHGDAHAMRDEPTTPITDLEDMLAERPQVGWDVRAGGSGPRTELLCGGLLLENGNAVLEVLPPVVHVRGSQGRPAPLLEASVSLLRAEMPGSVPGGEEVVTRAADVLIAQAIRSWLLRQDGDGLRVTALEDERIARAVRLVDARPDGPWSVAVLARSVAMSRSAFSGRFVELTGVPPMQYVAERRLSRSAKALRDTNAAVSKIALGSGYRSLGSFNRAFKRAFGATPSEYRRRGPLLPTEVEPRA